MTTEAPIEERVEEIAEDIDDESSDEESREWHVIVWDDPVNLMSYVVYVFRRLFGFSEAEATRKMLKVHNEGKCAVTHGPRERVELDCHRLHHYGLWATIEQA